MTEYDYSPEAAQAYSQTQSRVRNWTDELSQQSFPTAQATPPLRVDTKASWSHKKRGAIEKMTVADPNQVYAYSQKTTPYGTDLRIQTQSSDGKVLKQQSFHQTTRPVPQFAPQTLAPPPVNIAPLASNPYPDHANLRLPGPGPYAPLEPNRRKRTESAAHSERRSKSSHSSRRTPHPSERAATLPPVPPMPPMPQHERSRAHSNVRPHGAAAPLQPSNGARANGIYGSPCIGGAYLAASVEQLGLYGAAPAPHKAKSTATLHSQYTLSASQYKQAAQPQRPHIEQIQQVPEPKKAELLYLSPYAAQSAATLHAAPSAKKSTHAAPPPHPRHHQYATENWHEQGAPSPVEGVYNLTRAARSSATLYGDLAGPGVSRSRLPSGKRDRARAPVPEFPAQQTHMLEHPGPGSTLMYYQQAHMANAKPAPAPLATEAPRVKQRSLFKRIFRK